MSLPVLQKSVLGLLLGLFICGGLAAQVEREQGIAADYLFQDRLGTGLVFDILQDRQGAMWFATEFGLVRYDGRDQITFRNIPGDPNSLSGNIINCILEDHDGNLWIGMLNNGLNVYDPVRKKITRYSYDAKDTTSLPANRINRILADKYRQVWIATKGGGMARLESGRHQFLRNQIRSSRLADMSVKSMIVDRQDQLWVGTDEGLQVGKLQEGKPVRFRECALPIDSEMDFSFLWEDKEGNIWAATHKHGLFYIPPNSGLLIAVPFPSQEKNEDNQHIWQVYRDSRGVIWLATDGGLYFADPGASGSLASLAIKKCTLAPIQRALSVTESKDGVIWVGTDKGVVVIVPRLKRFRYYPGRVPGDPTGPARGITQLLGADNGQIWTGTTRGILQFDPSAQAFHQDFLKAYPQLAAFHEKNIKAMHLDSRNNLWISTVTGFDLSFEVFRFNLHSGQLTELSHNYRPLSEYLTRSIIEDAAGKVWLGNDRGLFIFDPHDDSLHLFRHEPNKATSLPSDFFNHLYATKNGLVWAGMNHAGVLALNPQGTLLHHYLPVAGDTLSLSHPRVRILYEDNHEQLWLGTMGGLNLLLPDRSGFRQFHQKQGLAENPVLSIMGDHDERIWLATSHWIAAFDQEQESFVNYGPNDGIRQTTFWEDTQFIDRFGNIYFGGDNGMTVFHPQDIRQNAHLPEVMLTEFLLFNTPLEPDPQAGPLFQAIHHAEKIALPFQKNVFTLRFSALSYINPGDNHYAYKLDGFDESWQYIGTRNETTYTNLAPGTYLFNVKARNNDGVWGPVNTSLSIVILPPWYQTWWAYGAFTLTLGLLILMIYKFQLNRQLEKNEQRRLIELDAMRRQFYTNITHEFRTPLTVILGMAGKIRENPQKWTRQGVDLIQKNGQQLLGLINQILDLSKLESGSIPLNYIQGNILPFLAYTVESFQTVAMSKSIDLQFISDLDELSMDYDPDKVQSIMINLIANALKFTPPGGMVQVFVGSDVTEKNLVPPHSVEPTLRIQVKDNGIGIAKDQVPHIFGRYYQVKKEPYTAEGSGIGLALTQQLVELLEGTIQVESRSGEGSTFSVELPIRREAPEGVAKRSKEVFEYPVGLMGKIAHHPEEAPPPQNQEGEVMILIVEDNQDVATYLSSCLTGQFCVRTAREGKEGFQLAVEYIPDLIISDVMMPRMDGYQLCLALRKEVRTSHIPIILLTAKADFASKLAGLERGADAYLAKPFHRKELLLRIENLLESRRRMQAWVTRQNSTGEFSGTEALLPEKEHTFLTTVRAMILEGISEGSYSVDQLARDVHMSTSQLYRKIKALTGQSTIKFFRRIQIDLAKDLLLRSEYSIAQIAYQTGFNDPAYFTRVFTSEIGISPTTFRKEKRI